MKETQYLLQLYKNNICPELMKELQYKTIMQVPKIEKIVVSRCIKQALTDSRLMKVAMNELALITGQKPVKCYAKKSIAGFKLRQGQVIGCKVTLRQKNMYSFLDRLINIAMPRIRDFKGIKASAFDKKGNLNIGIQDQTIFPEIDYDDVKFTSGIGIVIVTTANTDKEAFECLKRFNIPFIGKI